MDFTREGAGIQLVPRPQKGQRPSHKPIQNGFPTPFEMRDVP